MEPVKSGPPGRATAETAPIGGSGGALPQYTLRDDEAEELRALAKKLRDVEERPGSPAFYDRHWAAADQLPCGLRRFLEGFRRTEPAAACLVRGFPLDEPGPTPAHWDTEAGSEAALDPELYLALCGLTLGEPFTWASLQLGRIIQNILPIPGDEQRQNGYGSEALLEFHTEDGFHPERCDYLLLLGLRNDDEVSTIVASVRDIELSAQDRTLLSDRRFHILPDDEHVRQLRTRCPGHPAIAEMERMRDDPEPVAVLFGDQASPYLRIDRPFMRVVGGDPAAELALDRLMAELERVQQDVVVAPGSLLIVDNYLAVHGRRPFGVRYDGTDRWLKKLTVKRNLRRGPDRGTGSHRVLI
ncbi:MAG TPA: guanitoxin biosynthesis L-enduracididine beta-hydroxylase GntD [Actinocrinis sp.]|nr:guanitoxin biosynthesis L-enduracididine beta-hydroxylase GntD [Actinocrinis sp.]